jgi:integron integrase
MTTMFHFNKPLNNLIRRKKFLAIGYYGVKQGISIGLFHGRVYNAALMEGQPKKRLLDEVRDLMRVRRYALRTERAYCDWIRRFVKFHRMTGREDLVNGKGKVEAFLTHLAVEGKVSPSTQNQALNALLFLYGQVLHEPLAGVDAVRAARKVRVPVVLTPEETRLVIAALNGIPQLIAKILYGSGLRLMEALRLRIKDVDFKQLQVTVRDGKGGKDRLTPLALSAVEPLREHMEKVKLTFETDRRGGLGGVWLPFALEKKYPKVATDWNWQWVFPAQSVSTDPRSGAKRRHHVDPGTLDKALRVAVARAGIQKRVTSHTFRHSFATHLLQGGQDIRTIQELLGHADVSTTMIYTHVLNQGALGVRSPLDRF